MVVNPVRRHIEASVVAPANSSEGLSDCFEYSMCAHIHGWSSYHLVKSSPQSYNCSFWIHLVCSFICLHSVCHRCHLFHEFLVCRASNFLCNGHVAGGTTRLT